MPFRVTLKTDRLQRRSRRTTDSYYNVNVPRILLHKEYLKNCHILVHACESISSFLSTFLAARPIQRCQKVRMLNIRLKKKNEMKIHLLVLSHSQRNHLNRVFFHEVAIKSIKPVLLEL